MNVQTEKQIDSAAMIDAASGMVDTWVHEAKEYARTGKCATYIPALAEANPFHLGVCIVGEHGEKQLAGEWNVPFTMQSISKTISFVAACMSRGIDDVMQRVDLEPTGDAFNSIMRLESHKPGKPFNPMINAGAITTTSLLPGSGADEKLAGILDVLEEILDKRLVVNEDVFLSEWRTASLNRALAYYLEEKGFLSSSVEETLEAYCRQCSIEVTSEDLAIIGLVLANDGFHPFKNRQVFPRDICKITKALMLTCGMYNTSGKFAAFIGVPAKSGVSGGIMACVPSRGKQTPFLGSGSYGIGIYGPSIDEYGNSVAGVHLLKRLASEYDFTVF